MSREIKNKKGRPGVAIIVDGKDEKWYIEKVKEHYGGTRPALKSSKIEPKLPRDKKVAELFELGQRYLNEEYSHVILIMDFDGPLGNNDEAEVFKVYYRKYRKAHNSKGLTEKQEKEYGWMRNMTLIINNPCLEYWFLLHFDNTTSKWYKSFSPDLLNDIRKLDGFEKYDKSESYYNRKPDIFERLGGEEKLFYARGCKRLFDISKFKEQGVSEMGRMFDYFDNL